MHPLDDTVGDMIVGSYRVLRLFADAGASGVDVV